MLMKNRDGFTLLELIIVMALMAILWGVAYAMFYQSKIIFSLSVNKLQMCQNARIAMDGISRDLNGAMLKDKTDFFRSLTKGVDTAGLSPTPKDDSSILTFLSLTPNGSSTPVTLVTYYLSDADELLRAEYNNTTYIYGKVSDFIPDLSMFTYYKLAANMAYFNLAYGTGSAWLSSWDSGTGTTIGRLPNTVKVTLQVYGTGSGHVLERGTFTTEVMLPYRITH